MRNSSTQISTKSHNRDYIVSIKDIIQPLVRGEDRLPAMQRLSVIRPRVVDVLSMELCPALPILGMLGALILFVP